ALEIKLAFNDRHSAALTYYHLGSVAECQRRFEEAENACNKALDIFLAFNDGHNAAHTYNALGVVAQLQHRFVEAGNAYKKALQIYVSFRDFHTAGIAFHNIVGLSDHIPVAAILDSVDADDMRAIFAAVASAPVGQILIP